MDRGLFHAPYYFIEVFLVRRTCFLEIPGELGQVGNHLIDLLVVVPERIVQGYREFPQVIHNNLKGPLSFLAAKGPCKGPAHRFYVLSYF